MSEDPPKGQTFVKRIYIPRIVGLGLGFFCVASVFFQQETHPLAWLVLIANGFLWPHIAYFAAKNSRNPYDAEIRNLLIDSFLGGLWVPLMSFNPLPSATVIFMLSMDNVAVGGFRLLAKGFLAQLIGGLLAAALAGLHFQFESTMMTVLACLPMLAVFPISIGRITYALTKKLSQQKKEIERVNIELREANDKLTAAYGWMRNNRDKLLEDHHQGGIIFVVDQGGKIEEFTERALECTGKSRAELIGRNILDFIDASSQEEFKQELRNAWMGVARDFPVAGMRCFGSGESFEATLMRLTSEARRALLVMIR